MDAVDGYCWSFSGLLTPILIASHLYVSQVFEGPGVREWGRECEQHFKKVNLYCAHNRYGRLCLHRKEPRYYRVRISVEVGLVLGSFLTICN